MPITPRGWTWGEREWAGSAINDGLPTARITPSSFAGFGNSALSASGSSALSRFLAKNNFQTAFAKTQAQLQEQLGQMAGSNTYGAQPTGATMGNPTGNGWENVNRWNTLIESAIQRVARETGVNVPANVVKAVMKLESGGNNVGMNQWGYGGLMQVGPGSNIRGYNQSYASTPEGNIYYGVQELANWHNAIKTGNWIDTAAAYFSGYNYNKPGVSDGYGTTVAQYRQIIQNNLNQLNAAGGGGGITGGLPSGMMGGALAGNRVVDIAKSYVGKVPYVWGGIPGKGQTPWAAGGGWDCSGMTYWLDQNYGTGRLPMGSHYQYDYAIRTGQLFTNMNQLQPGDLVFIDTGWQGGAGANLNRAGHVGMYAGNGMMVHASSPGVGTILSPLANYNQGGYRILGAMHMSWSGGTGGSTGLSGGAPGFSVPSTYFGQRLQERLGRSW